MLSAAGFFFAAYGALSPGDSALPAGGPITRQASFFRFSDHVGFFVAASVALAALACFLWLAFSRARKRLRSRVNRASGASAVAAPGGAGPPDGAGDGPGSRGPGESALANAVAGALAEAGLSGIGGAGGGCESRPGGGAPGAPEGPGWAESGDDGDGNGGDGNWPEPGGGLDGGPDGYAPRRAAGGGAGVAAGGCAGYGAGAAEEGHAGYGAGDAGPDAAAAISDAAGPWAAKSWAAGLWADAAMPGADGAEPTGAAGAETMGAAGFAQTDEDAALAAVAACIAARSAALGGEPAPQKLRPADRAGRFTALWLFPLIAAAYSFAMLALLADDPNFPYMLPIIATLFNFATLPTVCAPVSVLLSVAANAGFVLALGAVGGAPLLSAQSGALAIVIASACALASAIIYLSRAKSFLRSVGLAKRNELLVGAVDMLIRTNDKLQDLSTTDELTGLENRRSFDNQFKAEWAWAVRMKMPIALISVDIDNFKSYNDNYGHLKGDQCLKMVAECLKRSLSRETDFVARVGGEEFMAIAINTSNAGVQFIAERIIKNIGAANIQHEHSTVARHVTVSIGCASAVPEKADSPDDLIHLADIALYESKRSGKNRYTFACGKIEYAHS